MTTEKEIRAWIHGYNRDFNGLCQALMWQLANKFGKTVSTQPSAIAAYRVEKAAGRINDGVPPAGSFVYWDIGQYGHVGFMLNDGRIFMGSSHVDEQWSNRNTGPQSLSDYNRITGAKYLGWSWQNGGNTVPFTKDAGSSGGNNSGIALPKTSTESDGIPGVNFYKRLQFWGRKYGGYQGPIDGALGKESWKAVQGLLKKESGYNGPIDGVPGPNTYKAMQRWAARYGYKGPIDGVLGKNSYKAIAKALNTL